MQTSTVEHAQKALNVALSSWQDWELTWKQCSEAPTCAQTAGTIESLRRMLAHLKQEGMTTASRLAQLTGKSIKYVRDLLRLAKEVVGIEIRRGRNQGYRLKTSDRVLSWIEDTVDEKTTTTTTTAKGSNVVAPDVESHQTPDNSSVKAEAQPKLKRVSAVSVSKPPTLSSKPNFAHSDRSDAATATIDMEAVAVAVAVDSDVENPPIKWASLKLKEFATAQGWTEEEGWTDWEPTDENLFEMTGEDFEIVYQWFYDHYLEKRFPDDANKLDRIRAFWRGARGVVYDGPGAD